MPPLVRLRAFCALPLVLGTLLAGVVALGGSASAAPVACVASTVVVTPLHSPDGSLRPFYADFARTSTKHSGYVGYELSGASGVLSSDVWIKLSTAAGGVINRAANQSPLIPVRATSQSGRPVVYAYLTATAATSSSQSWTVEVWNGKPGQAGSTQVCTASDGFSKVIDVISASANKIDSVSVSTSSPAIGGSFKITAAGDTGTMGAGDAADQVSGKGVFSMAPAMEDSWPADSFALTGVSVSIGGTTSKDKLRIYPGTSAAGAYTVVYAFTVRKQASGSTAVYPVQNIASGTQVKYTGSYPSTVVRIAQPTVATTLLKSTQSLTGPPYLVGYEVAVSNTSASPVVLDYLRDTPTSASPWSFVTGSGRLGGSAISDPANDAGTLVFSGPFTVPGATGGSAGRLVFSYSLSIGGPLSNSIVGQVGDVVLGGSNAGDNQVTVDPSRPVVTTATLPAGETGTTYGQTLSASGGSGSYTWALTSGSLPAGLSLNGTTGRIAGTPTLAGSADFTVTVTDGNSATGSRSFRLTIVDAASRDVTSPSGSLSLNGGAVSTTARLVTLGLAASDAVGVTRYRATEGSDCSSASWVDVTPAVSYVESGALVLSSGEGTKTACAQYGDAAGNTSPEYTASIYLAVPPSVVLTTDAPEPTNAAFTVTATFSEPVSGFSLDDIAPTNAIAANLAGSGSTYTFDVIPTADGAVSVSVGANVTTDAAGNGNLAAAPLARMYDGTRPSVSLSSSAPDPTTGSFAVMARFSEDVTGLGVSGVSVLNGAAANLAGSGTTYTFDVTPAQAGTVTVTVEESAASDLAGNGNTAAAPLQREYAPSAPRVTMTAHPEASTAETSARFAFEADVTATYACSLDDASFTDCASPLDLSGLALGAHRFVVRGRTASGATATASFSWTVVAGPALKFTLTPPADSQPDVAIAWRSATGDVTFTCSLDAAVFAPCPSPLILSDLRDGAHTFTVRATASDGAVKSETVTWTVRRRPARPPARVVIVSKMTAADMLGRPRGFRQATDRARSKGPFTRRLDVKLRIPTPAELESNVVFISNDPDFNSQRVFPIAQDELYEWTLRAGPSGQRVVYIRFADEPDAAVGVSTIVLDQELPGFRPVFAGTGHDRWAIRPPHATEPTVRACGFARRWLRIDRHDGFSGLNGVQIASNPNHPHAWRPFVPTFSYEMRGCVVYVRIEDRVGNISAWHRVVTSR